MSRRLTLVALALVAGLAGLGLPGFSSAAYVATSRNSVSTVTAAPDWTPPTVSMRTPASPVKGTVTVTADATDGETGIASVVIQSLAPGASSWTTLCTATAAPYSCSWATPSPDGTWSLRAIATDGAGYATISSTVETTVANNLLVQLADPGDVVKGSITLTASLYNAGLVPYSVSIQTAVAGSGTWKTLCTTLVAPYTCSWSTTANGFSSGQSYDLRAIATAGSTTATSVVVADVLVDNTAPTVTIADPGATLRGTVTLAATATDAESGVAQVQLQAQRSGSSTWTTACTITAEPFSCRYDTTQLADGTYTFRAQATDAIGNVSTYATVANRVVDNTVSAVSMEDPGAYLSGTVTLAASASSTAGVTSVRIDRAPSGTTSWTAVCTDTTAPYSCTWNTTTVADGLYDFRAVLVDGKGVTTTSTIVSARRVDNSPLRGYDVQAVNGGATAGRIDAGDVFRLTYTDQVNPASVMSGWTGASTAVTLRLREGNTLGLGSKGDTVDVLRNGTALNLGSVNLKGDYVKTNKSATFNATIALSTTTVNAVTASVVTVTVGTLASGSGLRTVSALPTMVWTPAVAATDLNGLACSGAPVSELGTTDKDF